MPFDPVTTKELLRIAARNHAQCSEPALKQQLREMLERLWRHYENEKIYADHGDFKKERV